MLNDQCNPVTTKNPSLNARGHNPCVFSAAFMQHHPVANDAAYSNTKSNTADTKNATAPTHTEENCHE